MELAFQVSMRNSEWGEVGPPVCCPPDLIFTSLQGCYFCVKQFALECSRIPMGQAVNSQVCGGDRENKGISGIGLPQCAVARKRKARVVWAGVICCYGLDRSVVILVP